MYEIAFLCGQSLGYYGSWSSFSLSHHYIVWLAAKKAYPHLNRPFNDYSLLGDDILITDKQGKIVDFLRKELKPKEIGLFPEEMVFDKERDILEHTVIHYWVKICLKWCSWYYTVTLSKDVSLDQLMDVPMCSTTWRRTTKDLDMIKFDLSWKYYDMGAGWDLTTTPSKEVPRDLFQGAEGIEK
ncbi:hypothetical protein BC332_29189 [Capsicum chinense]|nr:hypothetical protein BC332_29189 [Capsicum chinense]